jgi:signal transduction histidine kinase
MKILVREKSIARNVRLWMMAVSVIPLIIMATQGYHCARQAVLQLKTEHLETFLNGKKSRIDDWMTNSESSLQLLANYPCSWQSSNLASSEESIIQMCDLLSHAHSHDESYESIVLYDAEWNRVTESKHSKHEDERLAPSRFKSELESSTVPVISNPHLHEDGMIGVHIGVPIIDEDGSKEGYVVAVLDLSTTIYPILQATSDSDQRIRTYIVSKDGYYLSQTSNGTQILNDKAPLPEFLLQGSGDASGYYVNDQGHAVVATSTMLPELGWVLVSETNTNDAFMWLKMLRKRALVTGIITLLLVFVISSKAANRITNPLRRLANVAHSISEGHFEQRLEAFDGKEHREVAEAFNLMLDEIAAAQQKLIHTAALSAIGQLSTSIVHEMRNPLSAIKMNLHVLQRKLSGDELHLELAEIASEQVLRLEAMLTDLLQYGKKLELKVTDVDFDEFADDVIQCVRPPSDGKKVSVTMLNKSKRNTLHIDREHMLRAISNLADNAVHETPDGGSVTITAQDNTENPGATLLTIADTGPGIPERVAERLFEPFFTTKSNGVGLGLPNVKKIIELHGGTISFENNPNGGALFTIKLPGNDKKA